MPALAAAPPAAPVAHSLPTEIIDCHHHFLDPHANEFQSFLKSLGAPAYSPEDYHSDADGLPITKTVHVEALPDDGHAEARWVAELMASGRAPKVAAIVAQVDLSAADVSSQLDELATISPFVRGIRADLCRRERPSRNRHVRGGRRVAGCFPGASRGINRS